MGPDGAQPPSGTEVPQRLCPGAQVLTVEAVGSRVMNAQSGGEKSGPGDSLALRGRFNPYPGGRRAWLAHTVAGARHLPAVYLNLSLPPEVSVLDTSMDGFEALWRTRSQRV